MRRLVGFIVAIGLALSGNASAAPAARDLLLLGGSNGPSINYNFLAGSLPAGISFSRASGATYFDKTGTLQVAAANVPRFDYDPVGHAPLGLLIEPQSTNFVHNNTMVGASAGVLPTGWPAMNPTGGLTASIAGAGVSNGISYVDVNIAGTNVIGTNLIINLSFDSTPAPAAGGLSMTESVYVALMSGTMPASALLQAETRTSAGVHLAYNAGPSLTGLTSNLQRYSYTFTPSDPTTALVFPGIWINPTAAGTAMNFTLRLGMPQLEQQLSATSVISTSGSTATRALDSVSSAVRVNPNNFSMWFSGSVVAFAPTTGVSAKLVAIGDGTANNRTYLATTAGSGVLTFSANTILNSSQFILNFTPPTIGTSFTFGGSRGQSSAVAVFGSQVVSAASGLPMIGANKLLIGQDSGTVVGGIHTAKVRLWNRALSAQELGAQR